MTGLTGVAATPSTRATIVDVARAAQVSRQTVSNVLNRPDKVAAPTLERVRAEIARLGFTPHVTAQQLRRRKAAAFGFEVNPSGHGKMGHILDEFLVQLTVAAPDHGSHLMVFAPDAEDVIEGYRQTLATGLVDGFVLADTRRGDPRPQWLLDHDVPFVSFGRVWDLPDLHQWVDVDGGAGVRQGVAHLVEAGYDRIGFLGWPSGSPVGDDRRSGWLAGLADAGRSNPDEAEAEESVQDLDQATAAAERLLARLGPGSAVVCASDMLALGAVRAARNAGLALGPDVGVVGFDDTDVAEALSVTSIRQPIAEAARTAWQMLLSPRSTEPVLLTPELTVRSSSTRTPHPPRTATDPDTTGTAHGRRKDTP